MTDLRSPADWLIARWPYLLAVVSLAIGGYYIYAALYLAPYPGLILGPDFTVTAVEGCDAPNPACLANEGTLRVGDQLLEVGDLTLSEAQTDLRRTPFGGYQAGETVPVRFVRNGVEQQTTWRMIGPTLSVWAQRLIEILVVFIPFWVAGTLVLLFLHPRHPAWRLLPLFLYATGTWWAVGAHSNLRVAHAPLLQHLLAWFLVPIYFHLHLSVPTPLLPTRRRHALLAVLYIGAAGIGGLELAQILPTWFFNIALLLAIVGSFLLLLFRLMARSQSSSRPAVRLMLGGIGLAFGPGLLLSVVPALLNLSVPTGIPFVVTVFAVPLLPLFYTYALYKHDLGPLEWRANRLLASYGFYLLYISVFFLLLLVIDRVFDDEWIPAVMLATVFIVLASSLQTSFQRYIERLSYGPVPEPEKVIRKFAENLPNVLEQEALVHLIVDEILPDLLIHQSALFLFLDGKAEPVYRQNTPRATRPPTASDFRKLLNGSGRYITPAHSPEPWGWIRLVLPLQVRDDQIGVWLFGYRDPDGFYSSSEIALLTVLSKHVAVTFENELLLRQLQQQSTELQQSLTHQQAIQAQLVQAGKLASLGTLASGVAHELNNPLAGIKLNLRNLRTFQERGHLDPALMGDILTDIDDLVDNATQIVNHFRHFSHQSSGDFRRLDVNCSIEDALTIVGQQLEIRDIALHLDLQDNLPPVMGNANQLEQVFLNLISNACDALSTSESTDAGTTPAVTDRSIVVRSLQRENEVVIEVIDTGSGISPDNLEYIFDPFFTTKEVGQGTGLGLSISYGLVQSHGGQLEVESEPGEGTTFRIRLPVLEYTPQTDDVLK